MSRYTWHDCCQSICRAPDVLTQDSLCCARYHESLHHLIAVYERLGAEPFAAQATLVTEAAALAEEAFGSAAATCFKLLTGFGISVLLASEAALEDGCQLSAADAARLRLFLTGLARRRRRDAHSIDCLTTFALAPKLAAATWQGATDAELTVAVDSLLTAVERLTQQRGPLDQEPMRVVLAYYLATGLTAMRSGGLRPQLPVDSKQTSARLGALQALSKLATGWLLDDAVSDMPAATRVLRLPSGTEQVKYFCTLT